ncbi:Transketolase 2 [Buchnera aphidicola (Cinara kochiana kochiana)]|uniref:Transketolase n=1 Tax=Buchnera aphidicola (Cinara kochiana kochiana) TaxID=2518976 RepID=A0A451D5C0_9GAMM|nr:transketolase [Buchnera aphidicola]VFP80983.1 Transketolase 2 [Buchnera aphidicola (Cinara kochiana kochiana)]
MLFRRELSNAIRILSIDAIQKAQSGHPGAPMGMADIAEVLWRDFLKHNPNNPLWQNRDRFVLSNGHASMLLYSLLHLSGYNISIDDLKNFRQCFSKTPGHPEVGCTPGVEITTGPLGQGLASSVGMAIAEKLLSQYFNRNNFNIIDHYTWVFVGDGCLMEGISHEVCSLAGTWNLGKLVVFYDKNGISIDGEISGWFTDDTKKRFLSYNWHVIEVNGHNPEEIICAINIAKNNLKKPSLIICNTVIGFGAPNKSGKSSAHGAPLGEVEISLTRKQLKWNYPPFFIPEHIYSAWNASRSGELAEASWNSLFKKYSIEYPELSSEYMRRFKQQLPDELYSKLQKFLLKLNNSPKNISTREASQNILEKFGSFLPELIGGSADLAPSNLTVWSGSKAIHANKSGNYIHYGVREFGMTAIANGIYHHGGFIPYTATFLVFVDYARNAIRMAALMKTRQIFIYTHDSIGLGEDGPTHQPVEHISTLRYIPNLSVWRPCDSVETAVSWYYGLSRKNGPTSLILSRQNIVQFSRTDDQIKNIFKGGYILREYGKIINLIIIATGSEVPLAIDVAKELYKLGYHTRVVSMVSTDCFDNQDKMYRDSVLPIKIVNRVSIEAGTSEYWYKYVGINGLRIGIDSFGESGPGNRVFEIFGFIANKIVARIKKYFFS